MQETKWFGSEVYQVSRSVVLMAGRTPPGEGENVEREGVALVLSGLAVDAWKRGGSQWSAWSSFSLPGLVSCFLSDTTIGYFSEAALQ